MKMSERLDAYFMAVAQSTAGLSYAKKLQVGAVAVRDSRIICVGYNGTPPKFPNACEDAEGKTLDTVIHAEENLILYASKNGIALKGAILYITHSPCLHCARAIYGAGFIEVIYGEAYKNSHGLDFLGLVSHYSGGILVRAWGGSV